MGRYNRVTRTQRNCPKLGPLLIKTLIKGTYSGPKLGRFFVQGLTLPQNVRVRVIFDPHSVSSGP